MPAAMLANPTTSTSLRKSSSSLPPEKKYKCQFCNRAFSRSEHRSRHERSHTKERPFQCLKCRSTFVRRDLLLRHDRTVHAKDGGVPLHSDVKRRAGSKQTSMSSSAKSAIAIDAVALEQIEASSDGLVDLETAAMLMTDLHHKATAAMRSADIETYENSPDLAVSGASNLMDLSLIAHYSESVTIPRAPWEFLADSVSRPAATSTSTNASASRESYSPLNSSCSNSTDNCRHTAPHRTTDPYFSRAGINSAPMDDQLPEFGKALPYDSPQKLPKEIASRIKISSEEERQLILDNILNNDNDNSVPDSFRLPELASLNEYLSTYFEQFHHHLPFLHPASFEPTKVSTSLLLAVLSIGALHAFEQQHAYICHIGSKVLVNQFLQNKENFSSRKCPLWTMQSSLLNMIFASWSGDPKGLEWACSIKSLLANMVAGNRYELKLRAEAREGHMPSPAEWVEDEGCRRTYYAVYIFFGLLTLTYNHTPAISFNEFEDLSLPSTEDMWNTTVREEVWDENRTNSVPIPSFMDAHDNLFQGETLRYSAFASRVMINALFLEVWYHKRSPEALQDVVTEYKLRLALESWEKSLSLYESEHDTAKHCVSHREHPLIFNAMAMFRNTRARLEVDLKSVQEALRYHNPYEVASAMYNARDKVKRTSDMLKVIQECFNFIEIASLQGSRSMNRMSATTNWSVEHPLCGLDLMVILSLWLYRLENDEEPATDEEMVMYNKIRMLLDGNPDENYGPKLSSIVARFWGSLLDEAVVWGITRLMGDSFRLHSQALIGYEDENDVSNFSTPSMTSQGVDENDE
ncbi:C2H2 finger domain protein [Blumeria hordei DH14]|uniref:C2H2 finger domain protein n=1 Tax=Blumeria graminis f. sp. hordei (strain DH14) TaxID=546991 RepID=N1JHK5_BLUG1|nr:C2H2 finger domain protein [Blumeria hordei DH14]